MKKKLIVGAGAILAVSACALAFVAAMPNGGVAAKRVSAEGASAITDSEYEIAILESYNGGSEYGYTNDKPLAENNLLGGHMYGGVGGNRQEDFSTNLMTGVNETLTWRFTCGRCKNDTTKGFVVFGIETHGTTGNILDETKYPEGTDEYAIAKLTIGSSTNLTECSAMIMNSYIDCLEDFSVFWRDNAYGTKWAICYQVEGGEWQRLSNTASGNYTGTRGWDAHGYCTYISSSWTGKDAYRAKVKLAFAVTNIGSDHGNFRPSAILINNNKAAVKYLNALSYREGVCSNSSFDLNKGQSDNVHNQDLFHLATERANASFLANYELGGTKTSETTALGLYNHLVSAIPGLGSVKSSSSIRFFNGIASFDNGNMIVVIAVVAAATLLSTGFILIAKKKKQ